MAAPATAEAIRDVNTRYHDAAADHYDGKWGVDFGEVGQIQVLGKLRKLLGDPLPTFGRSLEIGAGTGYFSINMARAGLVGTAMATDISPGMLDALARNAAHAGVAVETVACDAEDLPFPDGHFDLVLGHAVLHHIPHLDAAFAEFRRVLRPGGTILFAGEPSHTGDRVAAVPKSVALKAAPLWRRALRARPAPAHDHDHSADHVAAAPTPEPALDGDALEPFVDVHAFVPDDLARWARGAGFEDVHVRGEELLANWFGWINRTLEATAVPDDVPYWWRMYAYRGYLALQHVDVALLESRLPARVFYNLMLTARTPG